MRKKPEHDPDFDSVAATFVCDKCARRYALYLAQSGYGYKKRLPESRKSLIGGRVLCDRCKETVRPSRAKPHLSKDKRNAPRYNPLMIYA